MAVLFMDSFDHWTTLPGKWTSSYGAAASVGAYGRFSTNGLRLGNGDNYLKRTIATPGAGPFYFGFAVNPAAPDAETGLFTLWDDSTIQVGITLTTGGLVKAYRGNKTALLATSTATVTFGAYHYYEVKITVDPSAGVVQVRVDGTLLIDASSLNTRESANTSANAYCLQGISGRGSQNWDFDDFYVDNAEFQGDSRAQCLVPTGNGNYAQWSPSAGYNYDCVEEKPPSTSDYVSSGTLNQIDTYVIEDLVSGSGDVVAVAANFYCQKSDAGSRKIAIATRLSGTDDAGTGIDLPSSWGFIQDIKTTKPGGGAWTVSDVNSAEFGVKVTV